ncbi:hypothetical protein [Dyadobacter sp. CY323]|uniref:hypothetical protein n=1 Tax=Dyadobacter sp. CY323 TaxID=2907302 RepID=UPI001F294037|nr:hypothetical protein [Dyadobacter sp. CY323]MCE6992072.1 hypothetical protein [Dyadobacter sp. CY323]
MEIEQIIAEMKSQIADLTERVFDLERQLNNYVKKEDSEKDLDDELKNYQRSQGNRG